MEYQVEMKRIKLPFDCVRDMISIIMIFTSWRRRQRLLQTLHASKCGLSTAQLPSYILDVIDSLTKAGYEAYIVGGESVT